MIPTDTFTNTATFRPIRSADNEQVARLIRTVMTEFGCVGEGYSINDAEVDAMYEAFSQPRAAFFVIKQEGRILGCGGIAPLAGSDGLTCELKKMYFYPALRGSGYGRRMVEQCLGSARALGYRRCYLETVERMTSANFLYQKTGFEKQCGAQGNTGHCSCDSYYVLEL